MDGLTQIFFLWFSSELEIGDLIENAQPNAATFEMWTRFSCLLYV